MRPLALFVSRGTAGFGYRSLRQCGGTTRASTHLRALSAAQRLSDRAERQDAFLRRGSTAWLRRAVDDGHLSGGLRLDAGLDSLRTPAELEPHHGLGHP